MNVNNNMCYIYKSNTGDMYNEKDFNGFLKGDTPEIIVRKIRKIFGIENENYLEVTIKLDNYYCHIIYDNKVLKRYYKKIIKNENIFGVIYNEKKLKFAYNTHDLSESFNETYFGFISEEIESIRQLKCITIKKKFIKTLK